MIEPEVEIRRDAAFEIMRHLMDIVPGVQDHWERLNLRGRVDILDKIATKKIHINYPIDIFADELNVMIGEHGRRLWVCTEEGTILRVKTNTHPLTLDDRRVVTDEGVAENEAAEDGSTVR